jgi:inosine-uridine nucleoside N-ribohydrolase
MSNVPERRKALRRLLVDTDTAADDPVALVMALRHSGVRVEAITVVAGNVPIDQGVQNALYTLELLGERVPVFCGASEPAARAAGDLPVPPRRGRYGRRRLTLARARATSWAGR